MIFLLMLAFWLMIRTRNFQRHENLSNLGVILAMAGATLTKGIPALLVPIFLRRWRWKWLLLYLGVILDRFIRFCSGCRLGDYWTVKWSGCFWCDENLYELVEF